MGRQKLKTLLVRRGLSPYFSLAREDPSNKQAVEEHLRKKIRETRLPFLVVNMASLRNDPNLLKHAKEAAKRFAEERRKKVLVVDKEMPQVPPKLQMWAAKHLHQPSAGNFRQQLKALGHLSRQKAQTHFSKLNVQSRLNGFRNNPRVRQVSKKIGYSAYQLKLEQWLADDPNQPPSAFKNYLRKIVKSKYFYWFLLYKVVGLFVKLSLVIYFVFGRRRSPQPDSPQSA